MSLNYIALVVFLQIFLAWSVQGHLVSSPMARFEGAPYRICERGSSEWRNSSIEPVAKQTQHRRAKLESSLSQVLARADVGGAE